MDAARKQQYTLLTNLTSTRCGLLAASVLNNMKNDHVKLVQDYRAFMENSYYYSTVYTKHETMHV